MTESSTASAGLKGVVAGRSGICIIDGEQGLLAYRGYNINDLAEHSTFEETTYLLWEGELPARAELADFTTMLAGQRTVPSVVLDQIAATPPEAPPMATLRTAVSALGELDPLGEDMSAAANRTKAARLTAQLATLAAAIQRCRQGLEPVAPDQALVAAGTGPLRRKKYSSRPRTERRPLRARNLERFLWEVWRALVQRSAFQRGMFKVRRVRSSVHLFSPPPPGFSVPRRR